MHIVEGFVELSVYGMYGVRSGSYRWVARIRYVDAGCKVWRLEEMR